MLTLVCAAFALGAALLSVLAWRLALAGAPGTFQPRVHVERVPRWHWLARPPVSFVARWLRPCVPARLRRWVDSGLQRADLDQALNVEQWLMAPLMAATSATVAYGLGFHHPGAAGVAIWLTVAAAGAVLPCLALRDRILVRQRQVLRDLPGYLDLLALALESGCAFPAALQLAVVRSAPSPLRTGLERVLREVRAGGQRSEALRRLEQRLGVGALAAAVAAIVQAEATGVSLAPVIRAQALRCTQQRFARAERLAMEAPVKMLGPLVLCIFPCTFIVIGFPIAVRLLWGL